MTSPESDIVGCCDLGGTYLRVALVDRKGTILARHSLAHSRPAAPELIGGIARELGELTLASHVSLAGVGAAVPGPLDPTTGLVHFSPNLGWRQVPFVEELEKHLHVPVRVDDDANCGALGEQWRGGGQGTRDFLYVTVGTGIGAGIVLNGHVYHGARGSAGELGHMTVMANGPLCSCGKEGCLEALAAGPALVRRMQEAMKRARPCTLTGDDMTARGVIAAARAGDERAMEVIETTGVYLGIGLANALNLLDPQLFIVGGGLALDAGELLLGPVRQEVERRALNPAARNVKIVKAHLGDDSGLIGAARLIWQVLGDKDS